jgi:L-iditol 2-dehydrogenase
LKAAGSTKNSQFEIIDMPKPDLSNNRGAIVRVLGCGLCGSDIVKIQRNLVSEKTVLGHEVVGILEEINSDAKNNLKVGDKVAVAHHVPCFSCRYCDQGSYSMCHNFKTSNLQPGGFAEYIYISEEHLKYNAIKVPDSVDDIRASFMEPLGCILRALDRAEIQSGQNVFVIGLGFIGLLFVQALKLYDVKLAGGDLIEERIQMALDMGVDIAFNSGNTDETLNILKSTFDFDGADVVILASGSNASIDLALKTVRDGGKILIFASIPDSLTGFNNNSVYYRELNVLGGYSSSPAHLVKAMNLITERKIILDKFLYTMNLEQINSAIEGILNHTFMKVYLKI